MVDFTVHFILVLSAIITGENAGGIVPTNNEANEGNNISPQ